MPNAVAIERFFEMPHRYTFQMPKLRAWVESKLEGRTLNIFGGITRLIHPQGHEIVHNDIRPEMYPDVSIDAYDIDAITALGRFQTVVFDPPYSAYQAVHSYGGVKMQEVSRARQGIQRVLDLEGVVISLGWNSTGMGEKRGYAKEAILLVNSGGSHNDIIITVERRT